MSARQLKLTKTPAIIQPLPPLRTACPMLSPYDVPGLGLHHEILQGTGSANHGGLEELSIFTSRSFRKSQISKAPIDFGFEPSRFLLRPARVCVFWCVLSTCAVTDFISYSRPAQFWLSSTLHFAARVYCTPSRTVGWPISDFRKLVRLRNNSRHRCWRHDLGMPRSTENMWSSAASNSRMKAFSSASQIFGNFKFKV